MIKRGKKAQFYIVAAILIILVVLGLMSSNYLKTSKQEPVVYNLADVLKYESAQVIDYGVNKEPGTMGSLIERWTDKAHDYSQNTLTGENMYFVYGNKEGIKVVSFSEAEAKVEINMGETSPTATTKSNVRTIKDYILPSGATSITLKIPDSKGEESSFDFEIRQGENFYLVIKTEKESIQK